MIHRFGVGKESSQDGWIRIGYRFPSEIVSERSFIRRDLYSELIERLSREYLRIFLAVIN